MIDLTRYLNAHEKYYDIALQEIKDGYKRSHWIWYIFPQIHGLGMSETAKYYEIKSISEAIAYLENEYLKGHLIEICEVLLELDNNNPTEILGYPDDLKLRSSMTLFNIVNPDILVFKRILDKYYNGEMDKLTLEILSKEIY